MTVLEHTENYANQMDLIYREKAAKRREYLRQWRADNADRLRAQRAKNRDKERAACRRYYENNREAQIARVSAWRKANPEGGLEYAQKRRERTPEWMTRRELQEVYSRCPRGLHVDHIVPLDGYTVEGYPVSGLNVPWNLWFITPSENAQKGSRMRHKDHEAVDATNPSFVMPNSVRRRSAPRAIMQNAE